MVSFLPRLQQHSRRGPVRSEGSPATRWDDFPVATDRGAIAVICFSRSMSAESVMLEQNEVSDCCFVPN
jgi:hypothetical protein